MLEHGRAAFDAASSLAVLQETRVRFLGKKGVLTAIMKEMGKLSPEERPVLVCVGQSGEKRS